MTDQLFAWDIDAQIKCVEREVRMREHVYPHRVALKKMGQELADREISMMKAVLESLLRLKGLET